MLTKTKLLTLYKFGALDEVAQEVLRYGDMVADTRYTMKEGRYKGENRVTQVVHKGLQWTVEKLNGEVIALEWLPAEEKAKA